MELSFCEFTLRFFVGFFIRKRNEGSYLNITKMPLFLVMNR